MTDGAVIWFELWVPDVTRARQFYGDLFGWTFRPMPEYDEQYWLIEGSGVGGAILAGDPPVGQARAGTVVYVAIPDLATATERCLALGGSLEKGVTAIGDGTSFALVRDPFGTRLGLWSREQAVDASRARRGQALADLQQNGWIAFTSA